MSLDEPTYVGQLVDKERERDGSLSNLFNISNSQA